MVQKFKTKIDKHNFDDEKRKESLKKRFRERHCQNSLIKNALESGIAKSRKIVFNDEILGPYDSNINENVTTSASEETKKPHLFEESDEDNEENYEISIKRHFEGKKGQKLLNLQSKYSNDERFRLDERFHEDEDEDEVENKSLGNASNTVEDEKTKQFKILETVLGHDIQSTQKTETKPKKNYLEMVRFDASNEDHKREEVASVMEEKDVLKKERRKRKKEEAMEREKSKPHETSNKKFYQVSDVLKDALRNRKSENGQFSLLEAFSRKLDSEEEAEEEEEVEVEAEEEEGEHMEVSETEKNSRKGSEVDSSSKADSGSKQLLEIGKVQGISKEKFFLIDDDPRFEEGLKFINMKNSEEAEKVIENYDKTRKEIRERLRLRLQKHRQEKNPFKKKIGGSSRQRSNFDKRSRGRTFRSRKH